MSNLNGLGPQSATVAVEFNQTDLTRFGGLPFFVNKYIHASGMGAKISALLERIAPRSLSVFKYSTEAIVDQLLVSLATGYADLNDAEVLVNDVFFSKTLAFPQVATSSTLSRFFNRFEHLCGEFQRKELAVQSKSLEDLDKADPLRVFPVPIKDLTDLTIEHAIEIVKSRTVDDFIIVDVDSTPVNLYGNQPERAFDGHYRKQCYLPILVCINGIPAIIQNAPGATNGAKLLLLHLDVLISKLKKHFPNKIILFRGDTGYNNNDLIEKIRLSGSFYLFGCNSAINTMRSYLLEELLEVFKKHPDEKFNIPEAVLRSLFVSDGLFAQCSQDTPKTQDELTCCTSNGKFRSCGFFYNYQAKSWSSKRTIAYRMQYNPEHGDVNIRFIQTNLSKDQILKISEQRGLKKKRSWINSSFETNEDDAKSSIELYEALFSDRGQDERSNKEWKVDCFASRCSLSGFFSNSLRMILSLVTMQFFERFRTDILQKEEPYRPAKMRAKIKPNVSRSHCAEVKRAGPVIGSIRQFLICLPAKIKCVKSKIIFGFPVLQELWRNRLQILIE